MLFRYPAREFWLRADYCLCRAMTHTWAKVRIT